MARAVSPSMTTTRPALRPARLATLAEATRRLAARNETHAIREGRPTVSLTRLKVATDIMTRYFEQKAV